MGTVEIKEHSWRTKTPTRYILGTSEATSMILPLWVLLLAALLFGPSLRSFYIS